MISALGAEDKSKEKPLSPAEQQYQAILKEYAEASKAFQKLYQEAKTDEEKNKLAYEKQPWPETYAPQMIALAQKYPKDRAAFAALVWAATSYEGRADIKDPRPEALALLLRDYWQSEELGRVCQSLIWGGKPVEEFLRGVLERSPHQDVQVDACLALARHLQNRAGTARYVKGTQGSLQEIQKKMGKEYVEACLKSDPDQLEAESEKVIHLFLDKYLGQLKLERVKSVVQGAAYSRDKGSELVLRTILEKDSRRELQGLACLYLARLLKERAERMPADQEQELSRVQNESEQLFGRAVEKFADVNAYGDTTVAALAKQDLDVLRTLAVGRVAPEIESLDQDGKAFKLRDYRGKVVLLDFWTRY
jgi:hypothetical protein